VEAQDGPGRELTRSRTRALEGHLWRSTPLSLLPSFPSPVLGRWTSPLLSADVEEHVGDAAEKRKRKRGKRKRGKGGQGAKDGPDRPQAGPVAVGVPPPDGRGASGKCPFPNPNNRPNLFLPREQRKADVDQRLAALNKPRPTRWDQPPVQAPRPKTPRRDTRRSPERTLDNSRRRQRTPSLVDRRAHPKDSKLMGFVAGALELIKERVLHQ
jgi:hypothetical protein